MIFSHFKEKLGLSFELTVLLGFIITIIIFSILTFYVNHNNKAQLEASRLVAHTNQVLLESASLHKNVLKAETGQRGYLITGEKIFLNPYLDAIDSIHYHIEQLALLVSDNTAQMKTVRHLQSSIELRLKSLEDNLLLRDEEGFDQSKRKLLALKGMSLMNDIQNSISELQRLQLKLLTVRKQANLKKIKSFNNTILISSLIEVGMFIALFVIIFKNLKKQKLLTSKLQRGLQEQLESKKNISSISKRLELATQAGGVGIWVWDIVNNKLEWDSQMYLLYGITENEFGGAYESWQKGLHPEDVERGNREIQAALQGEKDFDTEFRVIWPDSSIHYIKGRALIERDTHGNPVRMIGTNWDITKIKEHESKITSLIKELESFSYSVSHDLRAPLRSINGYANALVEDYAEKLDEEGKRMLGIVMNSARRMGQLIDDLLAFSRLGRASLTKTEFMMDDFVKQIADELVLEEKGRNISLEIKPLGKAIADVAMLRQVWINLLSNALKYSQKKETSIIEVGALDNDKDQKTFYVQDNGAGFDMAYSNKLFGVFQRLHKVSEFEGTGVGLALSKRIIDKHEGEIWAEAEVERGATFYFSLPHN